MSDRERAQPTEASAPQCPSCSHLLSMHDDEGCQETWGGYNDRQFCECAQGNPGNTISDPWWENDDL